jgi:hypothetical protein
MDYIISDKAKKTTLGVAIIGLVLLVFGFFQQKDFVYAKKISDDVVEIRYNGHADADAQKLLQEEIKTKMHGIPLEFHETVGGLNHDSHSNEHSENHSASLADHNSSAEHESHASTTSNHDSHSKENEHHEGGHHGPTFIWNVHFHTGHSVGHEDNHSEVHLEIKDDHKPEDPGHHSGAHHDNPADQLTEMINSGDVAFFDSGIRRFWSNLLINGFFFFGIALGALFYLALQYATESGWGVVLLRIYEGIMSAMPIGMSVLLVVFIVGSFEGHHIYPWMDSDIVNPDSDSFDSIIYGKTAYLNKPFFWIRVIAYFLTFYLFFKWFKKKSKQEDLEGGTKTHFKMYRRAALFLSIFCCFLFDYVLGFYNVY